MFSDNLLYLRNIKGLSQEQVAEAVGISRQSYSKWEQGDTFPDINKCDKLAKFYGVTIDSLIHADEKIGKTKVAPAPIGKHLWGTVTIGSKGQIVIPKNARDTFDMKEGDRLVVLGDESQGI
ncbi:MAG: helix-turn-helix domain-containing protein, partial [Eubacterium coprostanoligenes]|uniref:helix-turn-helix domain-containing protein n=1 Tax=Eubacterium coprostanoligenes TaxID=290054 RepID=UPI00240A7E49